MEVYSVDTCRFVVLTNTEDSSPSSMIFPILLKGKCENSIISRDHIIVFKCSVILGFEWVRVNLKGTQSIIISPFISHGVPGSLKCVKKRERLGVFSQCRINALVTLNCRLKKN